MFLSESDFSKVIKLSPLISLDLCIIKNRKILLGKRNNSPAKDYFFVPGGRIFKSELKVNALKRILKDELGFEIKIDNYNFIKPLGDYEHFYSDNFLNNNSFSTHYVVLAYLIPYEYLTHIKKEVDNEQHSEYIWFDIDLKDSNSYKVHQCTLDYLENPMIKFS